MSEEEKKENSNEYLREIINKYDFIESIYITDFDGGEIAHEDKEPDSSEENNNVQGILLAYNFNNSIDQTTKTEQWKMNNVTTVFDDHTFFQSKLGKKAFVHFICENEKYNHEVMKEIVDDLRSKMEKIEGLI